MMKRSFAFAFAALSLLFVAESSIFAQAAPKKVLSSKDVESFATNFEALNGDLDALGDKYDSLFATDENASPSEILIKLRSTKVPQEIQAILKKNGLGENGFEKLMIITIGFSALEMETYLNEQQAQYGNSPEIQPYIDQGMTQVKELKAAIHKDDLALLESKHDLLYPLLMADTAAGDGSEEPYDVGEFTGDANANEYPSEIYSDDSEDDESSDFGD
jgi:hypothetical protein